MEAHEELLGLESGLRGTPPVNGHSLPAGGFDTRFGQFSSEVDWEATRYLAAATQLNLDYARRVVRLVVGEPFRAVAPAAGADVVVVTRWALAALRRRAKRDGVLAFLLILGLAVAVWAWTWVPLALMVVLAVVVVAYERWIRDERVVARMMLRGRFRFRDVPSSPSPRVEKRLAVVSDQQNGNLVVFRGQFAFVGSGWQAAHRRMVMSVDIGRRGKNGKRRQPIRFSNPELHAALESALKNMGLPDLRVQERLYVQGQHLAADPRLLPDELGPPAASAPPVLLYAGCVHPTPDARTYLCAEIGGWKGQLVVSLFARAVQANGSLQVEWKFRVLPPLHQTFLQIDRRYELPTARQAVNATATGLLWSVPALISSPFQFARYAVGPLNDWKRQRKQSYAIRNGYVFNYGSWRSIREVATGYTRPHYFLTQDEITFILLAEHTMLRALATFLRDHNVDLTQFEAQEKNFINNVSNFNIDQVNAQNVAVGNRSRAEGGGKTKPAKPAD